MPPTASGNVSTDNNKEVQIGNQHPSPISLSAAHVAVPILPHLSNAAPRDEHMLDDQMTPQIPLQVVEVLDEQQQAPTANFSCTNLAIHDPLQA